MHNEDASDSFPSIVKTILGPNLESFGFEITSVDSHLVTFGSERVTCAVQYGRQSYEIRIAITLLGEATSQWNFSIGEIVRIASPDFPKHDTYFQSSKVEGVRAAVQKINELLNQFGEGALAGDELMYSRLRDQQDKECREYSIASDLRKNRPLAEAAWQQKQFASFISYLEPYRDHLSPSEIKKLDYAHRKLNE